MGKRLLMGIDMGTSGCKITVFDFEGREVASAAGAYNTYYPDHSFVEQDPAKWWQAVCQGILHIIKGSGVDAGEISAIGVDGTSWACLPVDRQGNLLSRAMIWLDRRAERQAAWMKEKIGEKRLIISSGNPVDSAYITPKILWLKENKPDIYKNTYKFLQSNAYIVYKLTGKYSQDYSQGYGFHFFNISKGEWDGKIAEDLGISLDLLAPLYHCHDVVGEVTRESAAACGLVPGIPVVAGGLDAACCSLGAGVINSGQTQEQGGQAGGMSIQVNMPLVHPNLILGYHVIPDEWLLQGGTVGGSGTLKWFNEHFGAYEEAVGSEIGKSPYEIMSEEAENISPGCEGLIFLPYMAGERSPIWNSKARGVFFGLSYDKTRAHVIRAMMEGVGFSLLHNLETARQAGANSDQLISVGGASNSYVWTQIKADITGKVIHVPFSENATALGSAILAGIGTGVYRNFNEAVSRTVKINRTHYPDGENNKKYREYYKLYLELYEKLKGCYETLYDIK